MKLNLTKKKELFWGALRHDLNISDALAQLFELHGMIHRHQCGTHVLKELGTSIGLFYSKKIAIPDAIQTKAQARWNAKKAKDFKTADALRADIENSGFLIEDTATGFRVRSK